MTPQPTPAELEAATEVKKTFKQCVECRTNQWTDKLGYCDECNRRLNKQEQTGRCGWCGRPVMDCICE